MQGNICISMLGVIYDFSLCKVVIYVSIIIIIIIGQTYDARNVIITIKYYKTNLRHGVCKVIYASLCKVLYMIFLYVR